ncbi:hypothetical protein BHM03_00010364 [Ensete ventricosum]|nr:hypothetical protein BHM03_00010364 [Ensete ventricosum]
MGGTYRSVRLPVRGPLATGRFRQKSTIGGRLREKSIVGGRLREKREEEEEKKKKKKRVPISPRHPRRCVVIARRSPAPVRRRLPRVTGIFSSVRGDGTSPRAGRKSRRLALQLCFAGTVGMSTS